MRRVSREVTVAFAASELPRSPPSPCVAACGDDDGSGGGGSSTRPVAARLRSILTPAAGRFPSAVRGRRREQLALEKKGGKAGNFTIKYVSLDDATASPASGSPARCRRTPARPSATKTIAYLDEFNSGATAISIPLLNEADILQVSPSNTYVGLTRAEGARWVSRRSTTRRHETFGRRPRDTSRRGQVVVHEGPGRHEGLHPQRQEVYGKGIADQVEKIGRRARPRVAGQRRHRHQGRELPLAGRQGQGLECRRFFFGGITQNRASRCSRTSGHEPGHQDVRPGRCRGVAFTEKLGVEPRENVFITNPTLDPKFYPPSAQNFFDGVQAKYGKDPEPYAIYGYEAMSLTLEAIEAAGDKGNDRQAVVDEFFKIKGRESMLETYDIDENGDTTLSDYGGTESRTESSSSTRSIKAAARRTRRSGSASAPPRVAAGTRPDSSPTRRWKLHPIPQPQASAGKRLTVPRRDSPLDPARRPLLLILIVRPRRTAQQRRRRALDRHDLGADRARLHAGLRHHRADQLRPRRGLHDRLVRLGVALRDARLTESTSRDSC